MQAIFAIHTRTRKNLIIFLWVAENTWNNEKKKHMWKRKMWDNTLIKSSDFNIVEILFTVNKFDHNDEVTASKYTQSVCSFFQYSLELMTDWMAKSSLSLNTVCWMSREFLSVETFWIDVYAYRFWKRSDSSFCIFVRTKCTNMQFTDWIIKMNSLWICFHSTEFVCMIIACCFVCLLMYSLVVNRFCSLCIVSRVYRICFLMFYFSLSPFSLQTQDEAQIDETNVVVSHVHINRRFIHTKCRRPVKLCITCE